MSTKPKSKNSSLFLRPRKLKTVLERVNQEMYLRNLELARTNRALSLLRSIDNLVLESEGSVYELSSKIAHEISASTSYPLVAILAHPLHKEGNLHVYGWNTRVPLTDNVKGCIDTINVDVDKSEWLKTEESTITLSLSELNSRIDKKVLSGIDARTLGLLSNQMNVKSVRITRLEARGRLVGLMVIGLVIDGDPDKLSENDRDLIERLSGAVGVALDNKFLQEENARVVEQLKRSNQKLKEMDETKDEFISMASHQLRTPLTSVKGYLSMVLEGDAGKITEAQQQLLNQAYVSSQRMVYLIADLLNVSRLKTGKFVINKSPTNLVEMVESEIAQLTEVAKSRKLNLTFVKPDNIPLLDLDETKTRQVVMNFVDNAIYYTPSGGKIKIEVAADRSNVYFMVKDNGIGVPKSAQSRLFGKFYRAKNAQTARPDGTGLGLFMAKKVITDQGGTILFESTEGKGSTFGFKFDRPKTPSK